MQSISRYIFKQLITATIAITVGLSFVVWLTQSMRFIDYIVNRGVPATTFLSFVTLLVPSLVGVVPLIRAMRLWIACAGSAVPSWRSLQPSRALVAAKRLGGSA